MPKKKRAKSSRPEIAHHVLEIVSWDWPYGFGINRTKFLKGPFTDHRTLTLQCNLRMPRIRAKTGRVLIHSNRELSDTDDRERLHIDPITNSIGFVWYRGDKYNASLHMPADVFAGFIQMLIADRYRFVKIWVEDREKDRHAIEYHFSNSADEE